MSNSEQQSINFTHPHISISFLTKKFYGVYLKDESDEKWEDFLSETLEYSKEHKCWIVNVKEVKDFIKLVKNVSNKNNSSDESESSESSTDDELIQKTLSRRLTSKQSTQSLIEEDHE